jgi:guanylate kinase
VLQRVPGLFLSVSATTRRPRPVERDGVDYVFVTDEGFDRMIAEGELLEWADVFGNRYGTPAEPIRRVLQTGRDALLEIDVQGARQVKERMPQAVLILLEPPSLAELERRLRTRGTEDEERLARRLAKAGWELEQRGWFDRAVVNEDLEAASSEVAAIIGAFPQVSDPAGEPEAEGTRADTEEEGSSHP